MNDDDQLFYIIDKVSVWLSFAASAAPSQEAVLHHQTGRLLSGGGFGMTVQEDTRMSSPYDVTISVHANRPTGKYEPLWNWFGYDEPNYTYSPHGKNCSRSLQS